MDVLLIHALKSEGTLIRQHYPQAKTIAREVGREFVKLKSDLFLLRTGIGLTACQNSLDSIVNPKNIEAIIHFGVSGSLSKDLTYPQIIRGTTFTRADFPDIQTTAPTGLSELQISTAVFFSSPIPVTDEVSRTAARSGGADAVDMESYAVASYCHEFNIPLLALRCISDRAGDSTPEEFKQNYKLAAQNLQDYMLKNILTHFHSSP